jgi:hypothetical protein
MLMTRLFSPSSQITESRVEMRQNSILAFEVRSGSFADVPGRWRLGRLHCSKQTSVRRSAMSAKRQKRKSRSAKGASGLPPKPDIKRLWVHALV